LAGAGQPGARRARHSDSGIRAPRHIRQELDLGYRLSGLSIEFFEIRPQWDDPGKIREHPFAKATYVRARKLWKVFWMRADLKWHGYPPVPTVRSIERFLEVVDADEHGCFFG
jgi:hypothetical protein